MNKLKGLSLFQRIILLFSVVILMILFNIILFNSLDLQRKNSLYSIKIIAENQVLNKEIILLSNYYSLGNTGLVRELKKVINKYTQNFILLKEGGIIEEDEEFRYKELNARHKPIIDTLNILNKLFIEDINALLDESSNDNLRIINNRANQILEVNDDFLTIIYQETNNKYRRITFFQILSFIVVIASLIFILIISYKYLFGPLRKISHSINQISEGKISNNKLSLEINHSEIGVISNAISNLLKRLKSSIIFIKEIEKGNFDSEFNSLSKDDDLGNTLLQIRETFIKNVNEENKRKEEDSKLNWTNKGLNNFYDLLRHNNTDIKDLGYKVIVELVRYLKANQGGFFIYNETGEEDQHLELVGSIAYDKRKYKKKKVLAGEGILGSCIIEKDTIYLSNIPNEYIETESGLGDANPGYLLIVPLKIEDELYGITEIASFNEFKKHEIEFVETLSENIATSLKSLKTNVQTAELLEQAQNQTEELHSQEEEMRQNMEELRATQEEATRKVSEMDNLLNAFHKASGTFEIDLDGYITTFNDQMLTMLDTTEDQLKGRDHKKMIESNFIDDDGYNKMWEELMNGISHRGEYKIIIHAGEIWLDISYTPVKNEQENVYKILACAKNITLRKIQSLEFQDNYELMQIQDKIYKDKIADLESQNKKILVEKEAKEKEIEELRKKNDTSRIQVKPEKEEKKKEPKENEESRVKEIEEKPKEQQVKNSLEKPVEEIKIKKVKIDSPPVKENNITIGITSVDEQHKKLLGLISNLQNSFKEDKQMPELQELIYDISEYSRYHFSYEEKYFKEFKYKETELHITEHQSFIEDLNKFQKDFDAGKSESPSANIESLRTWLVNHIGTFDKNYVKLFAKKGVK